MNGYEQIEVKLNALRPLVGDSELAPIFELLRQLEEERNSLKDQAEAFLRVVIGNL
jgi:hypothetical protein